MIYLDIALPIPFDSETRKEFDTDETLEEFREKLQFKVYMRDKQINAEF
jgi:hypothetical protein